MHLKLVFSYDPSDLFRVTAVISNGLRHAPEPVVAQYRNEKTFYDLLLEANVATETHTRLVHAIATAATSPNFAACCEAVELTPNQLRILRLAKVLTQTA
jgi:hypothetical protein